MTILPNSPYSMKKSYLFSLLLVLTFGNLSAQTCLPNGISFESQAEIDSFPFNYPGCTQVLGDVSIQLIDRNVKLDSLEQIRFILGRLTFFSNDSLQDLNGLHNLSSIGGDLSFTYNCELQDFSGLDHLVSIGGDFSLNFNHRLKNMLGLDSLGSIGGGFHISAHDSLTSLNGLEHLTSLEGGLLLSELDELTNISALSGLTSIGDLTCMYATALTSLNGLDHVKAIRGDIYLQDCYSLSSINQLSNVQSINGSIYIEKTSLSSLEGLGNIDTSGISTLTIISNNHLTTCQTQSICTYLADTSHLVWTWIGGGSDPFSEYHNAIGCNSPEEVLEACENLVSIANPPESDVQLSPNPSSGLLYIQGLNNGRARIVSTLGKILKVCTFSGSILDLREFPAGMYRFR